MERSRLETILAIGETIESRAVERMHVTRALIGVNCNRVRKTRVTPDAPCPYYRLHGHRWRRYWRSSFVIRLIPDNGDDNEAIDRRSIDHFDPEEDIEWRIEEIEEFA